MKRILLCLLLLGLPSLALAANYTVDVNTDKAFQGTTIFAETMDSKHPALSNEDVFFWNKGCSKMCDCKAQ